MSPSCTFRPKQSFVYGGKLEEIALFIQGFQCYTNITALFLPQRERIGKELLSTWVSRGLESIMVKTQISGDWHARVKDGEMQDPFLALPEAVEHCRQY